MASLPKIAPTWLKPDRTLDPDALLEAFLRMDLWQCRRGTGGDMRPYPVAWIRGSAGCGAVAGWG